MSKPNVRVALPVQVSYDCNLEQAEALMLEAAHDQKRVIFDDPDSLPKVFLKEFADNGIVLELAVWIRDPSEGRTICVPASTGRSGAVSRPPGSKFPIRSERFTSFNRPAKSRIILDFHGVCPYITGRYCPFSGNLKCN